LVVAKPLARWATEDEDSRNRHGRAYAALLLPSPPVVDLAAPIPPMGCEIEIFCHSRLPMAMLYGEALDLDVPFALSLDQAPKRSIVPAWAIP
jgi:hypothetical protein